MMKKLVLTLLATTLIAGCEGGDDSGVDRVRLTRGAGGVGFLPLVVMEEYGLIESVSP